MRYGKTSNFWNYDTIYSWNVNYRHKGLQKGSRVAGYWICLPWLKGLIWVEDMCCIIVKKMAKIWNVATEWKVFIFWFFLARIFPYLEWVRRDTIVWSPLMRSERGGKTLATKMQLSVTKTMFQWPLSLHFCPKLSLL